MELQELIFLKALIEKYRLFSNLSMKKHLHQITPKETEENLVQKHLELAFSQVKELYEKLQLISWVENLVMYQIQLLLR